MVRPRDPKLLKTLAFFLLLMQVSYSDVKFSTHSFVIIVSQPSTNYLTARFVFVLLIYVHEKKFFFLPLLSNTFLFIHALIQLVRSFSLPFQLFQNIPSDFYILDSKKLVTIKPKEDFIKLFLTKRHGRVP